MFQKSNAHKFVQKSLFFYLSILLILGCQARDPEEPSEDQVSWIPPSDTPLSLFENLRRVVERHESSYYYLLGFSDTFVYIPSEYDQDQFEETYGTVWSKNQEEHFSSNFFNTLQDQDQVFLTFDRTDIDIEDVVDDLAETAILYRHYELSVPPERTGFVDDRIQGVARLDLFIGNEGYWVIDRWEDTKITDDIPDWGELRNAFK
ncbi:MAG: hypothetical protein B6244_02695 [Candidatus Cloacimonetes bacterium 4572_55]|nr:MAG: hypothetical protein B6244_02695 [Candidatus Cloacimonetes bacterium 4572_55]